MMMKGTAMEDVEDAGHLADTWPNIPEGMVERFQGLPGATRKGQKGQCRGPIRTSISRLWDLQGVLRYLLPGKSRQQGRKEASPDFLKVDTDGEAVTLEVRGWSGSSQGLPFTLSKEAGKTEIFWRKHPTGFANELDIGHGSVRGVKSDSKFWPEQLKEWSCLLSKRGDCK